MKKGDTVYIRISTYPNERKGTLVRVGKVHSIIRVYYPTKYMLIKRKNTDIYTKGERNGHPVYSKKRPEKQRHRD